MDASVTDYVGVDFDEIRSPFRLHLGIQSASHCKAGMSWGHGHIILHSQFNQLAS